jgi:hypothetical protein
MVSYPLINPGAAQFDRDFGAVESPVSEGLTRMLLEAGAGCKRKVRPTGVGAPGGPGTLGGGQEELATDEHG